MHIALFLYRALITLLHPYSVVFAVYHIEAFELKAIRSLQKKIEQIEKVAGTTLSQ